MASNNYHFITHWRTQSTLKEVTDILSDAPDLVRWWPAVYLDVQVLEPGDERGLGKVVSLYTKGWLPYTLRWQFRVTDVHAHGFTLQAWGDFEGRGIWTFVEDGSSVNIRYDWLVSAEKPLLRYFSFLIKPLFAANHHWAMAKGEESLHLEIARRQAATSEERRRIPAPPGPTTSSTVPMLLVFVGGLFLIGGLSYLVSKASAKVVSSQKRNL